MGRLLLVHPCPVCNYHIEGELHEGGSGADTVFLRNHYALAICGDCHHLVSVLVANTDQETKAALKEARSSLVQLEAEAVIGDRKARELVPYYRAALDSFNDDVPPAISACTVCGSANIEIVNNVRASLYDEQDAWIVCPVCDEGRLLIETTGDWH